MQMSIPKLRGKIVEKGFTVVEFCKMIGMNPATFYRKLQTNGEEFTLGETFSMIRVLKLSKDEAVTIFMV